MGSIMAPIHLLRKTILVSVSLLSIGYGLYILINSWSSLYFSFLTIPTLIAHYEKSDIFLIVIGTLLAYLIIPILLCVGGLSFLLLLHRGRKLLIMAFTFDFLFRLAGALHLAYSLLMSKTPPAPQLTDGKIVLTVSLWPSYLIVFIELFLIYILTRKSIVNVMKSS